MTELLIPAGTLSLVRTAVRYGADAVYVGGEQFGLRAKAKNLTTEELAEAVRFCHERGRKLYVTANILAHNRDLDGVRRYFAELREIGPDAVIIADPGVFTIAKEMLFPEIAIHISTQANNVNVGTFSFWYDCGASRVVCGRELTLEEIAQIRAGIPREAEIEAFVHGAMCISYSGRCLLSNVLTGRDANLGACTHPCRWKYAIAEETRPGEYMPIEENERGTFIMNSKDLCMIGHIPELLSAGIDSFKVEGRMKHELYVATVARAYRMAIDACLRDPFEYTALLPWLKTEIAGAQTRETDTGFFFGRPGPEAMSYEGLPPEETRVYLGTVEALLPDGWAALTQKNKFRVGDTVTVMKPDGRNLSARVNAITDADGVPMESCPHPKQQIRVQFSLLPEEGDVLRT